MHSHFSVLGIHELEQPVLNKKTRVRLSLAVVEELNDPELDFDSRNLILRTYGLDTVSGYEGPGVHDIVSAASDEQLVEIAEYFELAVPADAAPKPQIAPLATARPLFIFASHLTEHKVLVGGAREHLLRYGIELFVAHETINHDTLWQDEIERALDRADAGLAFVHRGLRDSHWCDQEIGWLQGRHVPVMALRFDETPYGFFAKHQAQPVSLGTSAVQIGEMVVDRIAGKPDLAQGFASSLVAAMAASPSFARTDAIWKRLRDLSSLDAALSAQLLEAAKTNNQIFWATSALDGGESYGRVVVDFLRRQPGAAIIESDVTAYAAYLDAQDDQTRSRGVGSQLALDRRQMEELATLAEQTKSS